MERAFLLYNYTLQFACIHLYTGKPKKLLRFLNLTISAKIELMLVWLNYGFRYFHGKKINQYN
jgi:hypothetical protein